MEFWYAPSSWRAWLLAPLAVLYGLVVRAWHLAFDLGLRAPARVAGAFVISVGNLVVGGAGKTPVVIHLAQEATRRGHRVAVLSRGYGRRLTSPLHFDSTRLPPVEVAGDEPRLIARRCPGVTVFVGGDRVASARAATAMGATLLILDDGFQHRRLARDVDLLVDAGEGNGWLLPAGPLREPRAGRRRATHVWGRDGRPGDIEARHVVTHVRSPEGELLPASTLAGREVVLLLGVARPERVRASVEALGARLRAVYAFADHHLFTAEELARARAAGDCLVTTEKDAERLPPGAAWVLVLETEVLRGTLPIP
ncbi:MAG: tetraacyldisaccharide 4'-kinase [Myxococcota bacterium]